MALAILGLGAASAISIQKIVVLGNREAAAQDGARQVGATWSSRLELDALVWNDPNGISDIHETRWLFASIPKGPSEPLSVSDWMIAPEILGFGSPAAGMQGEDVYLSDDIGRGFHCTHIRLARVIDEKTLGFGVPAKVTVLADIRVVWRKDLAPMVECRTTPPQQIENNDEGYSFYRLPPILLLRNEASL